MLQNKCFSVFLMIVCCVSRWHVGLLKITACRRIKQCDRADLGEYECRPPWLLCRLSQVLCFVRNTKVHKSHRRSFFGRARAAHPRQPLQASSHPLFICEGRLTHPDLLHTTKPGPPSYGGGRTRTHARTSGCRAQKHTSAMI